MLPALTCALGVGGCLLAEWRDRPQWLWVAKPLASAAFLWAALAWGALGSGFGRGLLAGLVACAAGDVLLMPRGSPASLRAGMAAFGLGHLLFAASFLGQGVSALAGAGAMLAAGALATGVWRWLGPRLAGPDRLAVRLYLAVIGAMLASAGGAAGAGAPWPAAAGAGLFALSDLAVAQDRFVSPSLASTLWGLPAYYAAQLLIARGAGLA